MVCSLLQEKIDVFERIFGSNREMKQAWKIVHNFQELRFPKYEYYYGTRMKERKHESCCRRRGNEKWVQHFNREV
jgi:hypothetical protein